MKLKFLQAGKIVGTHGVRGMVRIQSWCDSPEFFCSLKKFYLDSEGKQKLALHSARPHGNVIIASIKDVGSIEQAEAFRGKVVYMDRKEAALDDGQYFIAELIGCKVFDADSKKPLGVLSDVSETGANDVWHIKSGDKEYLVPCIDEVVVSVDVDSEIIFLRPLKGIFPDEN